ncbi:PqqD family peptide modification chaperone [Actinopolyspora saharensis]|uniref:Coenzyme PQQ synthesis protein D (PqqD) n=1 Tax=Actinopolyspora saharensis TaxID=995062 RepID=A0A1H1GDJ9_9ACTN|nr:PqqD family peptide modification chaperone [Actinopolyspora saharensis]SDR11241.1 Coenzyme PQQ synthesis protein D (PqqD) [Actinopolyspora saharensis]
MGLLRDEPTARLNETAAWVLRDLVGGETPERVVGKLVTAYRVEPDAARRDVAAVAERLRLARHVS